MSLKQLAVVLLALFATPVRAEPVIGIAFPPVTNAEQRAFTKSALKSLNIDHVRIADTWARRGLHPELSDFNPLVRRLTDIRAGGLKVMLTIELDAPEEACGARNKFACVIEESAPFEEYVRTLLRAVGDQLDAIQIANEWDNRFPGDADAFIQVYGRAAKVIRAERPELTLVLGGVTGAAPYAHAWCVLGLSPNVPDVETASIKSDFCSKRSQKNRDLTQMVDRVLSEVDYDVADLHLYDAPGLWPAAVAWLETRARGRDIWTTEFGGPHPEFESQDAEYQAQRLIHYLDEIEKLPVARAYYFKLTDDPSSYHGTSGLFDRQGRAKPALEVFRGWNAGR